MLNPYIESSGFPNGKGRPSLPPLRPGWTAPVHPPTSHVCVHPNQTSPLHVSQTPDPTSQPPRATHAINYGSIFFA